LGATWLLSRYYLTAPMNSAEFIGAVPWYYRGITVAIRPRAGVGAGSAWQG
jgi:hypothetical protein